MDLGQSRRGVDMGPSAIRYAGFQEKLRQLGYTVHDDGNLNVLQMEQVRSGGVDAVNAHHLEPIAQACRDVHDWVSRALQPDEIGVFLGGDHSISIGTVAAVAAQAGGRLGVIWVDAHGDYNTPQTSPSGNVHGMALAALMGLGAPELTGIGDNPSLKPENVALVGVRDLDPGERDLLMHSGIAIHTMRAIDENGVHHVARAILDQFAAVDHLHVSLDLDSCDPRIAPGVGTPVNGGLTYREAHLLMEVLADSGKVRSVDVVEINPILDTQNQTASIAVELVASLLGKRIL